MGKIAYNKVENDIIIEVPTQQLKGLVQQVNKFGKDIYVTLMTKEGIKNTYLRETDEIIKVRKTKALKAECITGAKRDVLRGLQKYSGSVGSDPEMFVINKKTDEVIPSFLFLKGKDEGDKTGTVGDYMRGQTYADTGRQNIFWDGFQAEFNVFASGCLSWAVDSTYIGLRSLREKAKLYDKNAELTIQPTLDIPEKMLAEAKKEHVDFGCMPSLNAYGHKGMKIDGRAVPFRSAGGHIHMGCKDFFNKKVTPEKYVKALDAVLGVACVSLFAQLDDPKRRLMYGLAGEYRLPKHGLEYRTLSNAWMCHPVVMNIVFELARKVTALAHKDDLFELWQATEKETLQAINKCDVALARKIIARNEDMFRNIIYSFTYNEEKADVIYKTFFLGVESLIEDPNDLNGNWGLDKVWDGHNEGQGKKIGNMGYLPLYKKLVSKKL